MEIFYVDFDGKYQAEAEAYWRCACAQYGDVPLVGRSSDQSCRLYFPEAMPADQRVDLLSVVAVAQGRKGLIYQQLKKYRGQLSWLELGKVQSAILATYGRNTERLREAVRWDLKKVTWLEDGLDIAGYLHFAAPCLRSVIKLITAAEVENFLAEKEQAEFIKVLRFFTEIQESLLDEAHLILSGDKFAMVDAQGNDLTETYLSPLAEEGDLTSISQEDLIMSMLMTLMPQKIVVHLNRERVDDLLKMIEDVFGERLHICTGCRWCHGILQMT